MVMAPAPVIFATFAKFANFITFAATDRTVVPGGDTSFMWPLMAGRAVRVAYLRRSLHTRRVPSIPGCDVYDWYENARKDRRASVSGASGVGLPLCGAGSDALARGQANPAMLGRAIDAVVQLIAVRGSVDGEEQLIWYAAGSGPSSRRMA